MMKCALLVECGQAIKMNETRANNYLRIKDTFCGPAVA